MNHFQTILPRVRMLLAGHLPSQARALLDSMLERELLSREYHCALLREPDGEALARKISLTLLEKGDPGLALLRWAWGTWQAPLAERDPDDEDRARSGQCAAMELGPLEGGYLELLNSNADPLHLYHLYDQMDPAREEMELCSEPDMDTINCEQFSRLLCDMEGDEETREAYANIAFPEELPMDSKHRKLAEPLAVPMVTGTFLVGSVSDSSALPCLSPPAVFNKEPASSQRWLKETILMPVPPSSSLLSCLSLSAGHIQIVPTLPQGLWQISGAGTGVSGMVIYQGEVPQASQALPSSSPAIHSLPKSPERPGSTSPFAPSAADLPGMPEPALTSRADVTEEQMSPTRSPAAHEVSSQLPKWPERVEKFCSALRDVYQAEPAGPEGILVEVELVRARLERSSSKSQERELATLDWAERQPARGGLAEVLLAGGDPRRPRETQVIAVLGKAGQGKSRWAREASRAWARGQLPQYDFVFYLPCHCLDRGGDTYRLQDLLFSLGPRPLPVDDEVFSYVWRRPDRVLLILDASEGLEGQDGLLHSACGPVCTEPHSVRGLLAGLFQRKLLRGCTLLLTARPRGRLAQSLSKADALFEAAGFSAEQAKTYLTRYLERAGATERRERALELLQGQPFLLSHCHSPTLCRAVGQLSEALLELGGETELPSTLTGLYVGLLGPAARDSPPGALAGLARLAWELGRRRQGTLPESQFPSAEARAWAVAKGLVQPAPGAAAVGLAFSSFLLQCFLGAVWLALSSDIKDKELPQYLALTPRKKRPYDNWLEGVPRFLAGLVFQPHADCLGALAGPAAATLKDRKQKVLTRYLKRLQPGTLRAGQLLELLHCTHETLDAGLWQHVVQGLPARLSFVGTRLTPPHTYVLGSALEAAGRDFSLDLCSTGIDPPGLGSLVGLSCVTHFRAALSDMVGLWESLQQRGEAKLLRAVEEKFTIEPFKAKSVKDVEDLGNLVQIQRTRSSSEDTAGELPAVRDLKKLEFALGPVSGPQAFPKLVRILEAFSSLQHLDLDSLSENKIGDEGVEQLSATFPRLKALETLNLSQNNITDVGACKLAEALPSLAASLLRLSVYNNCICDMGAESLAHVLPDMGSLRVLDVQYNKFTAAGAQQLAASLRKCPHVETLAMWTPTIPFGVHEHLQQLDSRISLK
ncbi:MHC class II transactivator isoform X2 [Panthera tigris]|uniref:MHC class II transactivator isoform X2 n=1 Tax=Panthera tigris TaxID=9694 RepID=UPI001C6F7B70|nr:MHC class II transactivator isoform X2 [Panthera tigris]